MTIDEDATLKSGVGGGIVHGNQFLLHSVESLRSSAHVFPNDPGPTLSRFVIDSAVTTTVFSVQYTLHICVNNGGRITIF